MNNFLKEIAQIAVMMTIMALQAIPAYCQTDSTQNHSTGNVITALSGAAVASSASATEHTQLYDKYRVMQNAHGYAAEDANELVDKLHGRSVQSLGRRNASDGPDRIVDGLKVQTKYCRDAAHTIETSFNKETGMFRYAGQRLEIPSDQYDEAVELMKGKIREGRLPGITDPNEAKNIIRKGAVTYEEACRIARAGTVESIGFDIMTGAVTCGYAAGLSALLIFTVQMMEGEETGEAALSAVEGAAVTAGVVMASHVGTQQFLRAQKTDGVAKAVDKGASKIVRSVRNTKVGRQLFDKAVSGMSGAELAGKEVIGAGRRLVGSTVVSSSITLMVLSTIEVMKGACGKETWAMVGRDIAADATGVAGGAAGAWLGTALGTMVCPGVGSVVGGIIGGVAGGVGGAALTNKVADCLSNNENPKEK